jgi:diaminopimelate epimerase
MGPMQTDRPVNPLAGRAYAKMNGIGNEILVLDLRSTPASASAQDVRLLRGWPSTN